MKTTHRIHAGLRFGGLSLVLITTGGTTAQADPGGLFRRIGKAISHVVNKVEQVATGDDDRRDRVTVPPSPRPPDYRGTPELRTGPDGQTRYLDPVPSAANPGGDKVYGVSSRSYVQLEPGGPLSPAKSGAAPANPSSPSATDRLTNPAQGPVRKAPREPDRIHHDPFAPTGNATTNAPPQEPMPARSEGKTPTIPPATTDPDSHADVPFARIVRPGRVKMPFPPHTELDVQGMDSGSLAKDPTSGKMFRVP